MSSGLLIFRGLADDAQSGLTEILARLSGLVRFAQVFREGRVYGRPYFGREWVSANRAAFHVAAGSPVRREFLVLEYHATSLRRSFRRSTPVDFKRHHYRQKQSLGRWVLGGV